MVFLPCRYNLRGVSLLHGGNILKLFTEIKMIYGYVRVSTDRQTLENQKFEINNFCTGEKIQIDRWITETISGTKDFEERKLGKMIRKLKKGDVLICTEISRLGRNILQIMTMLNICMNKEVQVWTIKDRYRLGADIQSKVLAFAFSLSAEIERNLISQRTKEALARIKASGRKLGREFGTKNKRHILDGREDEIINLYRGGMKKVQIARIMKVSSKTIYNFLADIPKA